MRVLRFLMVGGIGFVIDASVFAFVTQVVGSSWAVGRACAFLTAVTATWQGNRRWTFRSTGAPTLEAACYAGVQVAGCLVNYWTFIGVLRASPTGLGWVPAYLCGCATAAAFNYLVSRRLVFGQREPPTSASPESAKG